MGSVRRTIAQLKFKRNDHTPKQGHGDHHHSHLYDMSQQTNPKLRSDVSRRAPIDSGLIRRPTASENVKEKSSEEYLAQITEEWHKRIDVEIKSLAQGMSALCQTALVSYSIYSMA